MNEIVYTVKISEQHRLQLDFSKQLTEVFDLQEKDRISPLNFSNFPLQTQIILTLKYHLYLFNEKNHYQITTTRREDLQWLIKKGHLELM